MRPLIVQMQMSVDGRVASSGPPWSLWNFGWDGDWPWDAQLKRRFNAGFERADAIVLSRPMAEEGYIEHWTRAGERRPEPEFEFARRIAALEKIVVSQRIERAPWPRTRIAGGALAQAVNAAKAEPGRGLLCFGGTRFVAALTAAGLVDEFEFYLNPAAAGSGDSIFPEAGLALELLDSQAYACGMVVNRYRPR
ncbi:dihydrofolate reductase family protein [Lysobacter enzymogenes]|uniref:dihydrofolate reductase family protein n=1 Tax=Lysobacter enzymogenes TaxID=69 RepID=UPI001A96A3C9|nr:dihydrofolate reductase family protein [Lysobacter enzymogenes]QQP97573.1 dihydrofolate reductase family protein [Lysobacter enzymogenes]